MHALIGHMHEVYCRINRKNVRSDPCRTNQCRPNFISRILISGYHRLIPVGNYPMRPTGEGSSIGSIGPESAWFEFSFMASAITHFSLSPFSLVSSSVPYYYYGNNANSYAESGFSAPIGSMRKPGGGRFPSSSQMRRKPSFQGARRRRPFWGKGKRRRPFRGRNRFWNRNQNRKRRRRRNKNRGHRSTEGRTLMGSIIRAIQTIFTRSIAMLSRMFNSKDELDKKT